jgi:photosystem II stability/assembly factor-like uncharacterized protein
MENAELRRQVYGDTSRTYSRTANVTAPLFITSAKGSMIHSDRFSTGSAAATLRSAGLALLALVPVVGAHAQTPPLAPVAPPAPTAPAASVAPAVDPALYDGLSYRMVGPFRGGRATAVAGIAEQPNVFFMGTTGGGVWKTDDAGGHWTNVTDGFLDVGNIGAIDVADSDPRTIYVGTGSASIRGNSSIGRGVWKSTDGGATWRYLGLPESGAIGKLLVHPTNPDVVYVAALGHPFGRNRERGVYRTRDGGATWEHVLFLNDGTGAVTLSMSPDNPDEIYAGMSRIERKPWTMISGGPEGGVYRTTNGGTSWSKLAGGLPTGLVGKVGVTVSPADPKRVWALVEAEPDGGLYRSDDRGATWTLVNSEAKVRGRPWYYGHVRADPVNPDAVYVMNVPLLRSTDGGKTFKDIPLPHGDVHDIWINPRDPRIFGVSNDGGTVVTVNDGRTFSSVYNQPTAELYDVQVDNQVPYRLYGSQQDNSSISVLQRRLHNSLRPQQEWGYAAGCETGPVALHPDHPYMLFGGCYGGEINRLDLRNDTRVSVTVYPEAMALAPRDKINRWQWLAPIVVSPHDPDTVYHASQYLYRSRDRGNNWTRISPDLTTNDPRYQAWPGEPITADNPNGAETFTTILAVTPSPHEARTIWVGTDDGRVQITRDGARRWTDITPPGLPPLTTVNRIEVSPHTPGRAYVAAHRYRLDDFTPYVFRTDDYGATWTRIADGTNGIPANNPVRVVREDDERRGLLYAGTEFGLFVSFDDGARWQSLQLNLPATPVMDLKVHRGDLAVATQGRSFWVLDDLGPLRELAADASPREARLYAPRPAARGVGGLPLREVDLVLPDDLPHGALIHYALAGQVPDATIEILDARGTVLRRFSRKDAAAGAAAPAEPDAKDGARDNSLAITPGFHRVVWDLRADGPMVLGKDGKIGPAGQGVKAPPGRYTVRLTAGSVVETHPLTVTGNPREPTITQADYDAQYAMATAVRDTITEMNGILADVRTMRKAVAAPPATTAAAATTAAPTAPTGPAAAALDAALFAVEAAIVPLPAAGERGNPAGLSAQYETLYSTLVTDGGYGAGSAEGRPTASRFQRKHDLDKQWKAVRRRLQALAVEELARFNAEARQRGAAELRLSSI